MSEARADHRRFLNRYYGISRHFYDASRKYFLFGRDRILDELQREAWRSLVEIGPGTGRNLRILHGARPDARYGGIDASDAMLDHARPRAPFATFQQGFAEDADYARVVGGTPPDRVLFSYCLSMVPDPFGALDHARSQLADGGEVAIVDFGDLRGLPGPAAFAVRRRWIGTFHVNPIDLDQLAKRASRIEYGPGRYYFTARVGKK